MIMFYLGDVLIHSIPHLLLGEHDHDHQGHEHTELDHKEEEHDHFKMIYIGVLILSGFLIFFIAEKVATRHFHEHEHASEENLHESENEISKKVKEQSVIVEKTATMELRKRNVAKNNDSKDSKSKDDAHDTGKEEIVSATSTCYFPSFSRLTASGWLNLLADSMHNFTDGIALGQ